ncbi:hypothetical protein QR680_005128 [Steinernema hermaphroditum]|uniref:Uncharacterized protein n=1 Tax=Steinernema hermaphroditum TaxID=289476 RepID=A0AA39HS60_9BILA|nr:hypothetical protein QR680_005128 [Steinernema hermaphroditum]
MTMLKDPENNSFLCPPKRRRFFPRRKVVQRKRLVEKSGYINLRLETTRRYYSFVRDCYTTLLAMKWRYIVLLYFSTMTVMWLLFASGYHLISYIHGDFDEREEDAEWTPCIVNARTFTDVLIYSFATQSTVGYGYRHMSNACLGIVFSSMMQLLLGTLVHGLITAFVINKLARPTKRRATLMFSKNAVIAMRDGKLCLMIRIGDMRKTCLAEAHVRFQLIKKTVTYEGEMLPYHQFEMDIGYKEGLDRVMVMWPITVVHEINEESPLYEISKQSVENPSTRFEIIVILEGVVESNGSTTQARTSYIPSEVLWGKKFDRLATYHRSDGTYLVDLEKFHSVLDVPNTPPFSAKELDELRASGQIIDTDTVFDEMSLMNQTTIHEVRELPRGHLFEREKTGSVSIQIESDIEEIDELPVDDFKKSHFSPSAKRKLHAHQIRREFDMF